MSWSSDIDTEARARIESLEAIVAKLAETVQLMSARIDVAQVASDLGGAR